LFWEWNVTGRLVIVGAGQAAFALAAKLRALKDERPITIIGSEDAYPYQRPPLSKKYLLGEMSFDRLMFRPVEWYAENNVDIRLSTWVEEIDRAVAVISAWKRRRLPARPVSTSR